MLGPGLHGRCVPGAGDHVRPAVQAQLGGVRGRAGRRREPPLDEGAVPGGKLHRARHRPGAGRAGGEQRRPAGDPQPGRGGGVASQDPDAPVRAEVPAGVGVGADGVPDRAGHRHVGGPAGVDVVHGQPPPGPLRAEQQPPATVRPSPAGQRRRPSPAGSSRLPSPEPRSTEACPISSATMTTSVPPRIRSVPNVWRRMCGGDDFLQAGGPGDAGDDVVGGAGGQPTAGAVKGHRVGGLGPGPALPGGEPAVEGGGQVWMYGDGPVLAALATNRSRRRRWCSAGRRGPGRRRLAGRSPPTASPCTRNPAPRATAGSGSTRPSRPG